MTSQIRPKRIGVTGNIGSGKSTVARLLSERGAALIDADELAREATADPDVLKAIATALGNDLTRDGKLNRIKTAELVFQQPAARQALNNIIHPWIRRETIRRVIALSHQNVPPVAIIFDIPLLYENQLERTLDMVIVVSAPLEDRIARAMKRSGLSEADIRARDAVQLPLASKEARADYIIYNGGSLDELQVQVDSIWQGITDA
ncbi:MAG: dephospho-CoA kinase [Chloroflexi bacterium AL-N5]|nr:dephospho-CoA kinase [Chloroflexi bacterium AL-N5]